LSGLRKFHHKSANPKVPPELLAKQDLDVGFVVDHENKQAHVAPPPDQSGGLR
jgi:hypothetical protein